MKVWSASSSTALQARDLAAGEDELSTAGRIGALRTRLSAGEQSADLRRRVGEFVGTVFYGTLLREMQRSSLKGPYFHGGRGEDAFQGQLGLELAERMGRAPGDPMAEAVYRSLTASTKTSRSVARSSWEERT